MLVSRLAQLRRGWGFAGVGSPSDPSPDLEDDFSTYTDTTDFRADPLTLYDAVEETLTNTYANVNLDTSLGYGGRTQSMRISFLDATAEGGSGTSGRCTNAGHGAFRVIDLPGSTTEVWCEVVVRFSTDFKMGGGSWGCSSSPEQKMFFGYVSGPSTSRFNIEVTDGQWVHGYPTNETADVFTSPRPDSLFDGDWHVLRFNWKVGAANTGRARLWLDGALISDESAVTISRTAITDITLGQTRNQGADGDIEWNFGMWRIWVNANDPGW